MSDSAMDELFGMMRIAKAQQEAVQAALDGLAAERDALAKERAALAAERDALAGTVKNAVSTSLAGAANVAAAALGDAARPVIDNLSGVVQAAAKAEASIERAGAWFAWKWVAVAVGGLVGVCLVAYASLAWQMHQVSSLRKEKAALQADVAALQANVAALEKNGGRIVMRTCGGRLCIEASSDQGNGMTNWRGPWKDEKNGVSLVIPKGY